MITQEKGDGKEFISHAPGYWPEIAPELWNDWKWQLKNRVASLAQLEKHLELSDEERSGVLLSGDKLAFAVWANRNCTQISRKRFAISKRIPRCAMSS